MIWIISVVCLILGIFAGFLCTCLMTGKRLQTLQKALDESIPKSRVKYLIHSQIQTPGRKKNKESHIWNGALMAVEKALGDELE